MCVLTLNRSSGGWGEWRVRYPAVHLWCPAPLFDAGLNSRFATVFFFQASDDFLPFDHSRPFSVRASRLRPASVHAEG